MPLPTFERLTGGLFRASRPTTHRIAALDLARRAESIFNRTALACIALVAVSFALSLESDLFGSLPGGESREAASSIGVLMAILASVLAAMVVDARSAPATRSALASTIMIAACAFACIEVTQGLASGAMPDHLSTHVSINAAIVIFGLTGVGLAFRAFLRAMHMIERWSGVVVAVVVLQWALPPIAWWLATEMAQAPLGGAWDAIPCVAVMNHGVASMPWWVVALAWVIALVAPSSRARRIRIRLSAARGVSASTAIVSAAFLLALALGTLTQSSVATAQATPATSTHSTTNLVAEFLTSGALRPGEHHPFLLRINGPAPDSLEVEVATPSAPSRTPNDGALRAVPAWRLIIDEPKALELIPVFLPSSGVVIRIYETSRGQRTFLTSPELPKIIVPRKHSESLVGLVQAGPANAPTNSAFATPLSAAKMFPAAIDPSLPWSSMALACFDALVFPDSTSITTIDPNHLIRYATTGGLLVFDQAYRGQAMAGLAAACQSVLGFDVAAARFRGLDGGYGDQTSIGPGHLVFVNTLTTNPSDLVNALDLARRQFAADAPFGAPLHISSSSPMFRVYGRPDFDTLAANRNRQTVLWLLGGLGVGLIVVWLVIPRRVGEGRYYAVGALAIVLGIVNASLLDETTVNDRHTSILMEESGARGALITDWVAVPMRGELGIEGDLAPNAWLTPIGESWKRVSITRSPIGEYSFTLAPGGLVRIDIAGQLAADLATAPLACGAFRGNRGEYGATKASSEQSPALEVSSSELPRLVRETVNGRAADVVASLIEDHGFAGRAYGFAVINGVDEMRVGWKSKHLGENYRPQSPAVIWWPEWR